MIPRFAHVRPTDLDGALGAHAAAGDDGAYYAGGTELLQIMKAGFAAYGTLIDLKGVAELRTIDVESDGWLAIGGAVTHREIERSELVANHVPALPRLIRRVANVRVRNTGTLGGNLAFAEPHSDPAAFLLACGAEVELRGPDGSRRVGIDELVIGPLMTDLAPGEIIEAVRIPPAAAGVGRAYQKIAFFERPAASVAVRLELDGARVASAVVAVGSLTDAPILVPAIAAAVTGAETDDEALRSALASSAADALGALEVVGDHSGSADFKRHLAMGLLEGAASDALAEASTHA